MIGLINKGITRFLFAIYIFQPAGNFQLRFVIRRIADRGENIQVWIEPVVFNDLLKWLNALDEKYALRVTQIDVSAAEKPGMVNVQRLEFGRG